MRVAVFITEADMPSIRSGEKRSVGPEADRAATGVRPGPQIGAETLFTPGREPL
jgi:hypothetical protein